MRLTCKYQRPKPIMLYHGDLSQLIQLLPGQHIFFSLGIFVISSDFSKILFAFFKPIFFFNKHIVFNALFFWQHEWHSRKSKPNETLNKSEKQLKKDFTSKALSICVDSFDSIWRFAQWEKEYSRFSALDPVVKAKIPYQNNFAIDVLNAIQHK